MFDYKILWSRCCNLQSYICSGFGDWDFLTEILVNYCHGCQSENHSHSASKSERSGSRVFSVIANGGCYHSHSLSEAL